MLFASHGSRFYNLSPLSGVVRNISVRQGGILTHGGRVAAGCQFFSRSLVAEQMSIKLSMSVDPFRL